MLIEKKLKEHDIVTVALINGQEVIGRFVAETDTGVSIKKPLTLVISQQGGAFQPFTITGDTDGEMVIRAHSIVSLLKTRYDVATAYTGATSGIVVPESKGLIL
jgi:hypothetical protein